MVWARMGVLPSPRGGPHPLFSFDLRVQGRGPLGENGLQHWPGTGMGSLRLPLRPAGDSSSLSREGGAAPPQTSGLSSKHVCVGQFHFDFWLFFFHSLSFSQILLIPQPQ